MLLFNSRLKLSLGKLRFRWLGPFMVKQIFPYGVAELEYPKSGKFKVNGQHLKLYVGNKHEKEEQEELWLHPPRV